MSHASPSASTEHQRVDPRGPESLNAFRKLTEMRSSNRIYSPSVFFSAAVILVLPSFFSSFLIQRYDARSHLCLSHHAHAHQVNNLLIKFFFFSFLCFICVISSLCVISSYNSAHSRSLSDKRVTFIRLSGIRCVRHTDRSHVKYV